MRYSLAFNLFGAALVTFLAFFSDTKRALALDLTAPFILENAQVLPKGVRNPRFVSFFMSVGAKYNGEGNPEALGAPINRTVHWDDIVSMESDPMKKIGIQAVIQHANLDPSGGPGKTTGQVNSFLNAMVPALGIGVTEKFTFAVAVPVVSLSVSADTGFSRSEDGQSFINALCKSDISQCNTAVNRLNNAVNEKLTRYGYEPIRSKSVSNIGDIQLIGKYLAYKDDIQAVTFKNTWVLPTGVRANPDAVIDLPTGEGRLQIGGMVAYDRRMFRDYIFNTFGGVTALTPVSVEKRIPLAAGDSVSPDKETLTNGLGGLFVAGASFVRHFENIGMFAGGAYNLAYRTGASYSGGNQFSAQRYKYLEELSPSQFLHSSSLVAGFSTVEWYQQKKFVYPFQANFVYSHPWGGRNVPTSDVVSGELILFF